MIYAKEYDGILRLAVKNNKSPEEVCRYAQVKETIQSIDDQLTKEISEPAVGDASQSAGDQKEQTSPTPKQDAGSAGDDTTTPLKLNTEIQLPQDREFYWFQYAERKVKSCIILIPEHATETQLKELESKSVPEAVCPIQQLCSVHWQKFFFVSASLSESPALWGPPPKAAKYAAPEGEYCRSGKAPPPSRPTGEYCRSGKAPYSAEPLQQSDASSSTHLHPPGVYRPGGNAPSPTLAAPPHPCDSIIHADDFPHEKCRLYAIAALRSAWRTSWQSLTTHKASRANITLACFSIHVEQRSRSHGHTPVWPLSKRSACKSCVPHTSRPMVMRQAHSQWAMPLFASMEENRSQSSFPQLHEGCPGLKKMVLHPKNYNPV